MRGTGEQGTRGDDLAGIIPAHAGNRSNPRLRATSRRDHPRACGEQLKLTLKASAHSGSSPRMRETVERLLALRLVAGIIPAHAGNSIPTYESIAAETGSSPRVRGAALAYENDSPSIGIIPARAGSSTKAKAARRSAWDHPRACGEQQEPGTQTVSCQGIIPARAGSSPLANRPQHLRWDHPRACGEQTFSGRKINAQAGSSPRVRGAAPRLAVGLEVSGIIPARAGSSAPPARCTLKTGDHPRACGEQRYGLSL